MAKFDINSYARRGAEVRIAELNQELESIYTAFPDLRSDGRGARRGRRRQNAVSTTAAGRRGPRPQNTSATATVEAPAARRRRREMTAAQRRAVSARMKRYWAERRKGKEK